MLYFLNRKATQMTKSSRAKNLTIERLKEALSYDPLTGVFRWLVASSDKIKVGQIAGCRRSDGYLIIRIDKAGYLSHRLAWMYVHGSLPVDQVDHINGHKDDNRIANLRESTIPENQQNAKSRVGSSSQFVGVSWDKKRRKWCAFIQVHSKNYYIGGFDNEVDAYKAYLAAKKRQHVFWASNKLSVLNAQSSV